MFGQEIASLFVRIGADTKRFERSMQGVESRLGRVGGAASKVAALAGGTALAGLTAFGAGLASSLKASAEFEQVMSGAGAVLQATGEEMASLNELALRLGKDTAFSAREAASAIEMLAKNGLGVQEILGGAADATVALAAATGADLSTAADVATDAMMQFGLQAGQMNEAINGIAGVVVSSKFDINDYMLALAQGGGVAARVGVSFQDFNTAIAAISSSFASGSDAGTSFKVFLQRLTPQSKKAAEMMASLGLLTEDGRSAFFDASGQMKSMAEIAELLQNALGGLSDEQRITALSTIFGTDAMRAAAALAEIGGEQFTALGQAMAQVDAQGQAAKRLDNLAGDLEQLTGSVETLRIGIGQAFTPLARRGIQWLTRQINQMMSLDFQGFARDVEQMIDAIIGSRGLGGLFERLAAAGRTGGLSGVLRQMLVEVKGVFRKMLTWMGQTAMPALWQQLQAWAGAFTGWITPKIPVILESLAGLSAKVLEWAQSKVEPLRNAFGAMWANLLSWFTEEDKREILINQLAQWGGAFVDWAAGLWPGIQEKLASFWQDNLLTWFTDEDKRGQIVSQLAQWGGAFVDWAGALWTDISGKLSSFWQDKLIPWITDPARRDELQRKLKEAWDWFTTWAGGVWEKIKPELNKMKEDLAQWISDNAPGLSEWTTKFTDFVSQVRNDFAAEWPKITETVKSNASIVIENLQNIIDKLKELADWPSTKGVEMGVNFAKIFHGIVTLVSGAAVAITSFVDALLTVAVASKRAMEAISRGDFTSWVEAWKEAGTQVLSILDGLKGTAIEDIAKWMDPLFWLGMRPESTGAAPPSAPSGGGRTGFRGQSVEVNVNVSGDGSALPENRAKLRELGRMIVREMELAGARL